MNKFKYLAASLFLLLASCGTSASNLSKVSVGMTKPEVINVLGTPESVQANGYSEKLTYTLSNSWNSRVWNSRYYVYLNNGKVVGYNGENY